MHRLRLASENRADVGILEERKGAPSKRKDFGSNGVGCDRLDVSKWTDRRSSRDSGSDARRASQAGENEVVGFRWRVYSVSPVTSPLHH